MQDATRKPNHKLYGGIAASVALHVIILIALFVRLPIPDQTAAKEETVSVEIVPPPEEQKPEEQKPEEEKPQEQALNLKMPEEKPEEEKQEPAPPPEPPKQEADEAGAKPPEPAAAAEEKPPEQEEAKQEEAKEEPPPPPPPEEAEQPKTPPPAPAAPEKAEEPTPPPPSPSATDDDPAQQPEAPPSEQAQQPEQPDNAQSEEEAQGRPLPTLRPVFAFGENDSGPRVTPDGNAAEAGEPAQADDTKPTEDAEATADTSEEAAAEASPDKQDGDQPPAPGSSQQAGLSVLSAANSDPLAGADDAGIPEGLPSGLGASADTPTGTSGGEPSASDKKSGGKPLTEAKRLFSLRDTSGDVATTAMGNIPRSVRAGQLCMTELREQLRHGSPAYQPEILPSYPLKEGNVLDITSAAFRAGSQWYDVHFRCEIDGEATKVVSFGMNVGGAVPRSQWKARRFPEY